MKSIIYIKQYLTALVFGLIMSVSCQQIPDLHEMMADIPEVPPQTADRYERLISEVGISLPFSASEIGTMIYQFAYDDNQRVKSIDLFAEYAAGEKYESHITYEYYSDGIQMNTFGTELFTGQLNGYTKYVFYDGILQSSLFRGIENIPDYSFGGTNQYSYEEGLLSSVVSNGSGEESLTFTREYEWSNHNIVKEVTSDSQGENFEISYKYTEHIDKCNLDFLKLAYYLNYYKGLYFTADKVAFRGLSSKNLPAEQVQFTDEETYTFEYEFDDDQYVKKVYIYMDGEIMQIMDIKYTDEETSEDTQDKPYVPTISANCYIVSSPFTYRFNTVKGNSSESVGQVASAEVLWESFGTDVAPEVGDLISSVSYSDGEITFTVPSPFKEGNAVIAARDAAGSILWSWHIWLTDTPAECVYANNAGTMMDRNLGATSATPGDVGALGLLYQWGRKDPFLGASSVSGEARSTTIWSSPIVSSPDSGTITYSVEHPMTFITANTGNNDWYYTGNESTDNTRWKSEKTIYDPCPTGWRVPDGGSKGIWAQAGFVDQTHSSSGEGLLFGTDISSPASWYPAAGQRLSGSGDLGLVGYIGSYWAATTFYIYGDIFEFINSNVFPSISDYCATGKSVRCQKE